MWYKSYLLYDLFFFIKFFFFICFFLLIFLVLFLINNFFNIFNFYYNNIYLNNFKKLSLFIVFFFSVYIFIISIYFYIFFYNNFFIINNTLLNNSISLYYSTISDSLITLSVYYFDIFNISISKFNLNFLLLFSILYPVIFLLMGYDFNYKNYYFYNSMIFVFILSYLLLILDNIILFYFIYELILILVFSSMYLSSNSRGSTEAALYFLGWAVLGSILISLGFILVITLSNSVSFNNINANIFEYNEIYFIYVLFFFGFGTKLST